MSGSFEEEGVYRSQLGSSAIKTAHCFCQKKKKKRKGCVHVVFLFKAHLSNGGYRGGNVRFYPNDNCCQTTFPLCTESLICHFYFFPQNHDSWLLSFQEKVSTVFILSFKLI